jgi:hypothetical protein
METIFLIFVFLFSTVANVCIIHMLLSSPLWPLPIEAEVWHRRHNSMNASLPETFKCVIFGHVNLSIYEPLFLVELADWQYCLGL